jgi:hypothetical protein
MQDQVIQSVGKAALVLSGAQSGLYFFFFLIFVFWDRVSLCSLLRDGIIDVYPHPA